MLLIYVFTLLLMVILEYILSASQAEKARCNSMLCHTHNNLLYFMFTMSLDCIISFVVDFYLVLFCTVTCCT